MADPGGALPLSVTVADAPGAAAAPKSSLAVYFSRDRRVTKGDITVTSPVAIPRIASAHHVALHPDVAGPRKVAPGKYWVIACADGRHAIRENHEQNNCAPSGSQAQVTAEPMTSTRLIDAALAAHQLSAGPAAVYKVFAAMQDARLPVRFRGDDGPYAGDLALRDANAAWPTLSAQQRRQVAPYLQGPSGPHGWAVTTKAGSTVGSDAAACKHTGPTGMDHMDAAGGRVRIWWPKTGLPNVAAAVPANGATGHRDLEELRRADARLRRRSPLSTPGPMTRRAAGRWRTSCFTPSICLQQGGIGKQLRRFRRRRRELGRQLDVSERRHRGCRRRNAHVARRCREGSARGTTWTRCRRSRTSSRCSP